MSSTPARPAISPQPSLSPWEGRKALPQRPKPPLVLIPVGRVPCTLLTHKAELEFSHSVELVRSKVVVGLEHSEVEGSRGQGGLSTWRLGKMGVGVYDARDLG